MNNKVFLNFRYDKKYQVFQDILFFATLRSGLVPMVAAIANPHDHDRLWTILDLIADCDTSIHDLTVSYDSGTTMPKLNMAFELGLTFSEAMRSDRAKNILILVDDSTHLPAYFSDIASIDRLQRTFEQNRDASPNSSKCLIFSHKDEIATSLSGLRNYFAPAPVRQGSLIPGTRALLDEFAGYQHALPEIMHALHTAGDGLRFTEQVEIIRTFIHQRVL